MKVRKVIGKGKSTSSKSLIITSDLHVGHKLAVGGNIKGLNRFWNSARDYLKRDRATVFIINGEPVDGDNPKEGGKGLWSNSIEDQMSKADELLSCFKMDNIGMTRGSNYHTQKGNTNIEQMFARMITAAPVLNYQMFGKIKTSTREDYDNSNNKTVVIDDLLQLRINGIVINIIHHVGGSRWFSYRPSALAKEMANCIFLDGKLWNYKDSPKIIIRSHTHQFVYVGYGRTYGAVTPAWKVTDSFQMKSGMNAASIGLLEIVIEQNGEFITNPIIMKDMSYPKVNIIDI